MWTKLLAGAGILALAGFFGWLYGNARYHEGMLAQQTIEQTAALKNAQVLADKRVADEHRVTLAIEAADARAAAVKPIILTNTREVTNYAQSPAGRVVCRDPQRVRDIDAFDAALWPAAPGAGKAEGGGGALHSDPATPPAGR